MLKNLTNICGFCQKKTCCLVSAILATNKKANGRKSKIAKGFNYNTNMEEENSLINTVFELTVCFSKIKIIVDEIIIMMRFL